MKPVTEIKVDLPDSKSKKSETTVSNDLEKAMHLVLRLWPNRCSSCDNSNREPHYQSVNYVPLKECNLCGGLGYQRLRTRLLFVKTGLSMFKVANYFCTGLPDSETGKFVERSVIENICKRVCSLCNEGHPLEGIFHTKTKDTVVQSYICKAHKIRQNTRGVI